MTDNLRRSIDSGSGSSQNISQGTADAHDQTIAKATNSPDRQPDLVLDIQALQILDSSDDCIKVLDLEGRILFMSRGGQVLLGVQDVAPFLNTSWIEFWQGADQQAASEAIAKARIGEVCTFQGCCPTPNGEPKWWDIKISPIRGTGGQVERLLCISRDITERRQIEDQRKQAEQKSRESEERYRAIINQAVAGVACTDLDGNLTLVNQKYCDITGYSADELRQRRMQDITHPEDLPRNVELFHRMRTEGKPFEIEKRYIQKDGSIVWVNNSVSVIRDRDGKPQSAVAIVLDITERKQAEAALRVSEEQFRLFTAASSDTVYKMSANWREMRLLEGKDFLVSTQHPSQIWLAKYIPSEEQSRMMAAIAEAIRTKSTFELEHQIIQLDGTIGWTFSRAIPLLNEQGEIVEWLGAASDVTARKQAELSADFLATVTQNLAEATCVEDIIQTIGKQLNQYLQISICAFIEINESKEVAAIHHSWHQEEVPSLVGVYHLAEFVTEEFFHTAKAGQTIIVRDVTTDPRIVDPARLVPLKVGSFINVPLIRNGEWKFMLGIYHQTPYHWRSDEIGLMRELANRIWTKLERTRVETALRESEEQFRTLTATIPQLIWTATPDGRVDYLSDQWADYIGLPPEQLYDWSWQQITHPEDLPNTLRNWEHSLQSGEPLEIQHRFRNCTGEWRWQLVRGVPVKDATGNIKKWVGTCTDIQSEVDIKEALRESEARFRLMADAVPQIVWITDSEGRAEFFNKQWSNYTGVPYEPTTAAEVAANFVHPDDGAMTVEAFNEARQTGSTFTVEHRIRAADGTYRWFLVKAEPYRHLETGEIIRWFGASIDIHDRKQAEAAIAADLRDTQLLRDLSVRLTTETDIQVLYDEILAAAIALTQADAGSFQFFDQTAQELLLLATQGISPTLLKQFNRLSTSCNTSCGVALTTGERAFVNFDVPASEDPDGSMRLHVEAGLLSAQSTPLLSRSGTPIGMVSTHWRTGHQPSDRELRFLDLLARQAADLIEQRQDEAQRKQLLEREQAAREEAERANRIKDEFLAVLSHELRSPLNPILGWAKLLQNGKLDETKTTQALATIERNAKLQSELIEDLLDVSRILRGKLSLNVAPVNLASIIRAAMETVRLAAETKSIQIAASLAEDIGLVSGDSTRLQQVFWNLLSNAVKFTSPGGQVNIRLERVDSSAQITVSDTGQGIAPDFLPYVFDYFRQADAATTRKFGGLGLGLAIVRHLVELHGGTVSVASLGEGQGATFTVRVPLMSSSFKVKQDQRSLQPSLDLSGIKILVVDDETDTRELVAFILEEQGAQVTAATSAHEALLILPQVQPDVLLSDIGMPDMDGYMLIQQVRALDPKQGGHIPAIALTAYAGDTNQQQVLAAGFQKHISKPIEPEKLVQAIAHLVHPH